MDAHGTLHAMLAVGRKYSFDVSELKTVPLRVIVLSVKYVSREALWNARFGGDEFVHWELLAMLTSKNALGGCAEWLGLLGFCQWDELHRCEGEITSAYPILAVLRRSMRECNLDTGGTDAWTLVCKVFVLMLVQGLPSQHVLEVLTCSQFKKDTHNGCIELLAKQASLARFITRFFLADHRSCGRPSTCSRPRSTSRRWGSCWTRARWTARGSSRRRPWRRPRRRTRR
jgi:hypothetical protein